MATLVPGAVEAAAAFQEIESVAAGGLDTRAAALLLSGQEGGDLLSAVAAFPRPGGEGGVDLVVDLAGAGLLEGLAEDQPVIVEIYAYALVAASDDSGSGGAGGVRGFLTQAFFIEDEGTRSALSTSGIKFLGYLPLPPGSYSLRVFVLHRRADRFSLEVLPVAVPGPEATREGATTAGEPVVAPAGPADLPDPRPTARSRPRTAADPVLVELADPWLLVRPEGAKDPAAPPWTQGQRRWVPAARPVLAGGQASPLLAVGPDIELRLLDPEDRRILWQGAATADGQATRADLGGRRWLELPVIGLEPGEYFLAAGKEPLESEPQEVVLVAAGSKEPPTEGGAGPWFALEETMASTADGGVPVPAPMGIRQDGSRAMQRAYLEALLPLGSEQPRETRETVAAFERAQMAEGGPRQQNRLAEAEVQAVLQMVELANGDSTPLATLVWLHEELYREYHQRQEYLLAVHSRSQVLRLGQIYVQRTRDSRVAARTLAAALVSMAGYLQEVGSNLSAAQTYEQALELDRTYPPALLGLAVLREAYGEYDEAVKLLRRLVREEAGHSEGRLRLGVNLRRSGDSRPADEILRSCLSEDNPEWVRTVAFQELAELAVAEGRPAEAVEVLRQGLAELPGEPRLAIQLAAVLDRLGRSAQASAVLEEIEAFGASQRPSARFRYGQWPRDNLLAARRSLTEQGRAQLPRMVDLVERLARYRQGGGDEAEEGKEASP